MKKEEEREIIGRDGHPPAPRALFRLPSRLAQHGDRRLLLARYSCLFALDFVAPHVSLFSIAFSTCIAVSVRMLVRSITRSARSLAGMVRSIWKVHDQEKR